MSHEFHVGQKVVCIDDKWPADAFYKDDARPVRGQIYTIRDFFVHPTGLFGVRLVEIVNSVKSYELGDVEAAFDARRFRPLRGHKSDISIFKAMLAPQNAREDA